MIYFPYDVTCYYVVSFSKGVVMYCMYSFISDVVFYDTNNFFLGVLSPLRSWTLSLIHPFQNCEVGVHFVPDLKNSIYYVKTFVPIVCVSLEYSGCYWSEETWSTRIQTFKFTCL